MKIYTYSQARQQLAELLNFADKEEVLIRRRDGAIYAIVPKQGPVSAFDVPGIKTKAATQDIVDAVLESRSQLDKPKVSG